LYQTSSIHAILRSEFAVHRFPLYSVPAFALEVTVPDHPHYTRRQCGCGVRDPNLKIVIDKLDGLTKRLDDREMH
jgi:hypothetical protein